MKRETDEELLSRYGVHIPPEPIANIIVMLAEMCAVMLFIGTLAAWVIILATRVP